jgi:hypothetical protein
MPAVTLKERQTINKKLKQMGFGGLDDANIFSQIATLYKTHDAFRGLLMSTAPDQRRIAYESLKHHLSFTPKPLDVYEREIKDKAEREQWDVWNGTAFPDKFKVGEVESDSYKLERQAQEAIEQTKHEKAGGHLELVCTRCTLQKFFPGKNRKLATKDAYDAGWRWDERNGTKRTYCPDHVPGRCTMTLACTKCEIKQRIRVWDEQDGYKLARLRGWLIADDCTCPECTVKALIQ